jgi:hypothetical protein
MIELDRVLQYLFRQFYSEINTTLMRLTALPFLNTANEGGQAKAIYEWCSFLHEYSMSSCFIAL